MFWLGAEAKLSWQMRACGKQHYTQAVTCLRKAWIKTGSGMDSLKKEKRKKQQLWVVIVKFILLFFSVFFGHLWISNTNDLCLCLKLWCFHKVIIFYVYIVIQTHTTHNAHSHTHTHTFYFRSMTTFASRWETINNLKPFLYVLFCFSQQFPFVSPSFVLCICFEQTRFK